MKARIVNQAATLYEKPGLAAIPVAELPVGSELTLGAIRSADGMKWVSAALADGRRGVIRGDTPLLVIKRSTLVDRDVPLRDYPSARAPVVATLAKGATIELFDVIEGDGAKWVTIRDASGRSGYIAADVKIKSIAEAALPSRDLAKRNMLVGGLWCVGGAVVTAVTLQMASGGGTYFVAWGAMLFGLFQFAKGLWQFLTIRE